MTVKTSISVLILSIILFMGFFISYSIVEGETRYYAIDIYGSDGNRIFNPSLNQELFFSYFALANNSSNSTNYDVEVEVVYDNKTKVFSNKIQISLEPKQIEEVNWKYTPTKKGQYSTSIYIDDFKASTYYFEIKDSTLPEKTSQLIAPPLKQIKLGIDSKNIECKIGLELIFKSTNNLPACVKPESIQKLIERGWTNS